MWLTTQHTTIIVDVSCVASGQSSTITGTYVGQYVMQGFLDLKLKPWLRNLMTRSIAIIPSLVVSAISGYSGPGNLITISSMILSFDLPFVLIPLVKFTGSKAGMGSHKNSITKWRKKRPRQTTGGGGIVFVNNFPAIKGGFQSASDPGVLQLAHGKCSTARLSN